MLSINFHFYYLLIACCVLLVTPSCKVKKYQVVETQWKDAKENVPTYSTIDSCLQLDYQMWNSGGKLVVTLHNNTDSIMYLDLENSYLKIGDVRHYYYTPHDELDSSSVSIYYLPNGIYVPLPSRLTDVFPASPVMEILPHGYFQLKKFYLNSYLQLTLDYKKNFRATQRYTSLNTPLAMEHVIQYYTSDSIRWQTTAQDFYVSGTKSWTSVRPSKIYRKSPHQIQRSRFYVVDDGVSALGTACIAALVMLGMALGGR